jgi:hypothetical protein
MRRSVLAAGAALAMTLLPSLAQATEWAVEARYSDAQELRRAAARFQHARVDRERHMLLVRTDEAGIEALRADGLDVGIDHVTSARMLGVQQHAEAARRSAVIETGPRGYPGIPGFACYRTVEGTYATMDDLAAAHPDLVEVHDIGPSWRNTQNPEQGYRMRALRITHLPSAALEPERPVMVAFSSIHAREYAPAEMMTRFAEWLIEGYGIDPEATWLVDHNDFRLILQANPDGRKVAEGGESWRKNVDDINGNCSGFGSDGIDLNRNFPFHWNITQGEGSSGNTCEETYRGPFAQSEAETDNLVRYVTGICDASGACSGGVYADRRSGSMNGSAGLDDGGAAPDDTRGIFFDMHSYAELVLWSWGDVSTPAPNQAGLRTLGRRLAWFNDYTPQQAVDLYPTDGTTDDTVYGLVGVPAFTFETDDQFFQSCASFESNTLSKNLAALRYASRALHAPYRLPSGPDTLAVDANGADLVAQGEPVTIEAALDSSRFNQSNGNEMVRDIASAAAWVDQLPWDVGALPIAMNAADGAFDSSQETAVATLSTAAWASGIHFVHVQGVSAVTSQGGTPNAVRIDVAPADQIAALQGSVSDRDSGLPLDATITLRNPLTGEIRSTHSDAVSGDYRRTMREGVVSVRVSAADHLVEEIPALALDGGTTTVRDFVMLPDCTVFEDDVENGASPWTAQSPWSIASNIPGNATRAWTTGAYGNNLNRSLSLANALDLSGYSDISLRFDDRCDTEDGWDFGYAEYSIDGGGVWNTVYSCNGRPQWQAQRVALPESANGSSNLRLRFRLQSDGFVNASGWSLDNIRVQAGGDACRAQQQGDLIFADDFDGTASVPAGDGQD